MRKGLHLKLFKTSHGKKQKTEQNKKHVISTPSLPPQLTHTGGFILFYCKNTTGNIHFKNWDDLHDNDYS